jgi:calpain-7
MTFYTYTCYRDPDGQPELSQEQRKFAAVWLSPASVLPNASMTSPNHLPQDVIQGIITDCSVCASISVCIDHHRRFSSRVSSFSKHYPVILSDVAHQLALSSLFPQDQSGMPCIAKNGQYSLRFLVNGAYRRVSITSKPFVHLI